MEGSTLDYTAVTAAYTEGQEWLETVLAVIHQNHQYIRQSLEPFPGVTLSPLEGTYLLWMDLGGVVPAEQLKSFVQDKCGLAPDYGAWFWPDHSREDTHIRLNLAAPPQTIRRVADQLVAGLAGLV